MDLVSDLVQINHRSPSTTLDVLLNAESDGITFVDLGFVQGIAVRLDNDSVPQSENSRSDKVVSFVYEHSLNETSLFRAPNQSFDGDRNFDERDRKSVV